LYYDVRYGEDSGSFKAIRAFLINSRKSKPKMQDMEAWAILMVLAGALAGGFVNGMTSFGTALASLPFLLQVLEPVVAAQLVAITSVSGQLVAIRELWPQIEWRRTGPLLVAGLLGLPLGVALVPGIDQSRFKLLIGLLLVAYCLAMLFANGRVRLAEGGTSRIITVGFFSGILGGLAALSGMLVTILGNLESWSRDRRRATSHAFNMIILGAMLAVQVLMGQVSWSIIPLALMALPATMLGVAAGAWTARRLNDTRYDRLVLAVLLVGGVGLVLRSL
jgi:hypothetical protein